MCRIQAKNVLFGDCNILESVHTVLVVDCGSANIFGTFKLAVEEFENEKLKSSKV